MIELIITSLAVQRNPDHIKAELSIDKVILADIKKRDPLDLALFRIRDRIVSRTILR